MRRSLDGGSKRLEASGSEIDISQNVDLESLASAINARYGGILPEPRAVACRNGRAIHFRGYGFWLDLDEADQGNSDAIVWGLESIRRVVGRPISLWDCSGPQWRVGLAVNGDILGKGKTMAEAIASALLFALAEILAQAPAPTPSEPKEETTKLPSNQSDAVSGAGTDKEGGE